MNASSIAGRMELGMRHHREGRLIEAGQIYGEILAEDKSQSVARHNLGMVRLGLGDTASALELLTTALLEDEANPGWRQSLPLIGMTLYQRGFWEAAQPWLERAALAAAADAQVGAALDRVRARDYLGPEIFDAALGRVLKRYSPREAASYVYAIDVAGTCNLRCPTCPVGNSPLAARGRGLMEVELFRRIIDKVKTDNVAAAPEIFLFNWGEPLLHPRIGEIIAIVRAAGLPSHVSTNLNIDNRLREVARANPTNLKISLSGFTAETYGKTHVRGDITMVKSNMYRLRHELDKYKATTRVWVGHHLYRSNQSQVPEVAALCRELGFEHYPMAAFFQPLERLIEAASGEGPAHPILDELLEHPRSYVPRIKATKSRRHDCELRFNQTAINYDGTVALCCGVYDQQNMLGAHFLDHSHSELEAMKYAHSFCRQCMDHGVAYVPSDPR